MQQHSQVIRYVEGQFVLLKMIYSQLAEFVEGLGTKVHCIIISISQVESKMKWMLEFWMLVCFSM